MIPFNYHCHAQFSDGKSTAEEMVLAAIEAGCDSFGLSEHYVSVKGSSYSLKPEREEAYKAEVLRLKEKYKNDIAVVNSRADHTVTVGAKAEVRVNISVCTYISLVRFVCVYRLSARNFAEHRYFLYRNG